jgi:hypothetical protein
MIRVKIEDLKPGMILAKPVQNHQGVLLLDAGTKITKKNIRIFKSWGVIEIFADGELNQSRSAEEMPAPVVKDSAEMELKAKFSDVLDDPVMVEIFKAARNQLKKNSPNHEHEK